VIGLGARPVRALVLITWAGFFVTLWAGGDAERYLGPRTTWVVPFGAVTLSAAALGYGVLALRSSSGRQLTGLEAAGSFALIVPILAVLVVPRAELGAQAARKKDTNRGVAVAELSKARKDATRAAASAAAGEKTQVAKIDFLSLASVTTDPAYARDIGIKVGTRVRFTGFTVRTGEPGRFQLARFLISCCAADAVPVFIEVDARGAEIPPDNAWLDVTGKVAKHRGEYVVAAESLAPTERPSNPYLTSWDFG
jgi:uncharacterized repeat protein (TIGR03943 family)